MLFLRHPVWYRSQTWYRLCLLAVSFNTSLECIHKNFKGYLNWPSSMCNTSLIQANLELTGTTAQNWYPWSPWVIKNQLLGVTICRQNVPVAIPHKDVINYKILTFAVNFPPRVILLVLFLILLLPTDREDLPLEWRQVSVMLYGLIHARFIMTQKGAECMVSSHTVAFSTD